LQEAQEVFDYLPDGAVQYLSEGLEIPLGLLYRLATFYDAFSLTPRGKHLIRICMGTACYVKGSLRILEAFQERLGIAAGNITDDKQFSLETVNCLGCCGQSPVITVDDDIYGYMKQTKVAELVAKYS
jgi:NADH:ubiquinone oxidoreductase subunit E